MNSSLLKQLAAAMSNGIPVKVKMINGDIITLKPQLKIIGENSLVVDSAEGIQTSVLEASEYQLFQE